MSNLKFTDGEEFDLSGPLRLEKRYDGWYVLGNNRMIPVNSQEEGLQIIKNLSK
jgi:hypothetical protein